MKNDILKISGVSFSKFSYFWPAVWAFGGFPGNFDLIDEHMQKESPRGCIEDHFVYSQNSNIETTKNDENDDFSDFDLESIFEAGEPQGSSKSIPGIKK